MQARCLTSVSCPPSGEMWLGCRVKQKLYPCSAFCNVIWIVFIMLCRIVFHFPLSHRLSFPNHFLDFYRVLYKRHWFSPFVLSYQVRTSVPQLAKRQTVSLYTYRRGGRCSPLFATEASQPLTIHQKWGDKIDYPGKSSDVNCVMMIVSI